jgi:PAS domain S-box-containing protein
MLKDNLNVLLIEDDEDDYIVASAFFDRITHPVINLDWAENSKQAYDKVKNGVYDILLVDYRLGQSTGIDLIEQLRTIPNFDRTPFILLTGQNDPETDNKALTYGASDYLIKGSLDEKLLERSIRYAITHKATISELNEKERKFRELFERSLDPIFIADENFEFTDANIALLELFLYEPNELNGQSLQKLFVKEAEYQRFIKAYQKKGVLKAFEVDLCRKDDKIIPCQISISSVVDKEGTVTHQGIIQDISLKLMAEREMVMAEKLSTTGRIARSIAHEIRNPLTNLNLALEQLKDEIPENEDAELYTGIIQRNLDRIEELITQMLNSSKQKDLKLVPGDIHDMLSDAIRLCQDRVNLLDMKLYRDFDRKLPAIMMDKDELQSAFLNLMINAIEAMEPGKGELHIGTDEIQEEATLIITVADNGSGIPKEDMDRLFDAFFTGKKTGMGLGLVSVQNIIKQHKGRISVESEVGKGTKFTVRLPMID